MENDPIKYNKTIGEKINDLFVRYILRPPMKNSYFISSYEIDGCVGPETTNEWNRLSNEIERLGDVMLVTGASFDEVRNNIIQFSRVIK